MKATLRIARTELASLFYSPIAWLLLIVFMVQTSMVFAEALGNVARVQFLGGGGYSSITETVFSFEYGTIASVQGNLLFFIPLLTMGLISRELHSGSIKLLLSSPVTLTQIILGKYLAMMGYFFLFALFLVGLMLFLGAIASHVDYALALSGILGIYLLAGAYAAIGLFMSSLTTHQVVAAVGTLAVLAILGFIGGIGQRVPLIDELAYWLSIAGRVDYIRQGLISSKDVLYFLAIIVLFLSFTWLKLSAGRKIETSFVKAGKYAAVLLGVVTFGCVTSLPHLTFYADVTRGKKMTLSKGSLEVMKNVRGPWSVTAYVNVLDEGFARLLPKDRNYLERGLFDRFVRQNPDATIEFVDYYGPTENQMLAERYPGASAKDLARRLAAQDQLDFDSLLSTEEMNAVFNMKPESYRNIYKFDWDGKTAIVRNFADQIYLPSEEHFSTALRQLTQGSKKLAYVTGHGERSIRIKGAENHQQFISEKSFRYALVNNGFEVRELSLRRPVQAGIDILVLAAPKQPLSADELRNLQAYKDSGGNLIILGEPGSGAVMAPILAGLGVEFIDTVVTQPKQDYPAEFVFATLAPGVEELGLSLPAEYRQAPLTMPGTGALRPDGASSFKSAPLVTLNSQSKPGGRNESAPADTSLGLALYRDVAGRQQRILVMADADFMSTAELAASTQNMNQPFLESVMRWMSNGAYPVDTSRPAPIDTKTALDLREVDRVKIVLFGVIPLIVFCWGAGLLIHRRRR